MTDAAVLRVHCSKSWIMTRLTHYVADAFLLLLVMGKTEIRAQDADFCIIDTPIVGGSRTNNKCNNTRVGETCKFGCNGGYHINGKNTRTCEKEESGRAVWKPETPKCDQIKCDKINIPNKKNPVSCTKGKKFNSKCTISCNIGYSLKGHGEVKCTFNETIKKGVWSPDLPSCEDVDECSRNQHNCNLNTRCDNTPGSFTCTCNAGYTGNGVNCRDINECEDNPCDSNSHCVNNPGSFVCPCNDGYQGSGMTGSCMDINECASRSERSRHYCSPHAECKNTNGSFTCLCKQGYTGSGHSCSDINECSTNIGNCHQDAFCYNNVGSFECSCKRGYTGDGIIMCSDVDECSLHYCDVNAKCDNTDGGYTCSCGAGYRGTGRNKNCQDIDECMTNQHNCDDNANCINTHGSYSCSCKDGYSGNGVKGSCQDINECLVLNGQKLHNCSPYAVCQNTPGSFNCQCPLGYGGNGTYCTGIISITSKSEINVEKGEEVTLSYDIYFVKDSVTCTLSSQSKDLQSFTLVNSKSITYSITNAENSAWYLISCTLAIDGHTFHEKHHKYVNVQVPANIQLSNISVEVMRNSTTPVVVSCISVGNPRPTVMWYKNEILVTDRSTSVYQTTKHVNQSTANSDLILTKAQYNDAGTYDCKVQNVHESGETEGWAHLQVIVKGVPELRHSKKYTISPKNNEVEFSCTFDGYPTPDVQWTFANGSSLPVTSQFQFAINATHPYRVSKKLRVYGVKCKETSLLLFKCSATNEYNQANPVQSGVFHTVTNQRTYTSNEREMSCKDALDFCKSYGDLAVVSNKTSRNEINSLLKKSYYIHYSHFYYYWISAKSNVTLKEDIVQNVDGCIRIYKTGADLVVSKYQSRNSFPFCRVLHYAPQTSITADPITCDGRKLNISWEILPGAMSFAHRVQVFQNPGDLKPLNIVEAPTGERSLMLANLQPRKRYHIKILPLFLGCENAPLRGGKNAVTGRGNLTAPHRIELTFNQSADTCILSWPSLTLTNQDEEIGYFDIKITEFINSARSNTLNSADVNVTRVEKSTSNYVISNLNPNTDYQVEVGVVPSSPCRGLIPTAWSDPVRGACVTSPSSPPKIELKLSSTSSPTSRGLVSIILTPVSERNGIISCYFVVVQIGMPKKNNFVEANIDNLAQADEPVDDQPYIAMALERFDEEMKINLGDGSLTCCDGESLEKVDCAASSERRKRRETSTIIRAQNRPLPAETNFTYYAVTSTLSKTGKLYTASPRSGPIVIRPEISADFGYIIAIVVGLIIVIVIIVAIVMYKRRICKKSVRRDTPNCISMQRRTPAQNSDDDEVIVANPVQVAGPFREFDIQSDILLKVYLSKRRNDDFIFLEEFQTNLKTLVAEQSVPTTSAKHTENVQKNRFKNIAPIDDARVKLVLLADQPHTDYINASFIDGYSQTAKFIATQGPKENTLNDFWRMVFEQRCKVIVMVTQLREGHKTKCEKYWHDPGKEMAFGNILVRTNNEIFYGDYICRYFSVKCTSSEETLAVTHFQYLSWPDHGIPPTTSSLLRLHRAALHAQMDNKSPLLVHCSAGVGRTGTFIALDILSEQLEREGKVNVFATVYQMRMKRTEMVQSLAQYVYIHKLLTEISMFENTDVDVSAFSQHEACLNVIDHSTRTTGMQIQFNWLNSVPPSFAEMSSTRKQVNKNLNLVPGILPYDNNLACVEMTSKDKDVPCINASIIATYNAGCYFIVAQDPVPTNIDIFWRCLVDNCIACIVTLDEDESCVKYWPEINTTATFENINVKTTGTTQSSHCVERTFEVSKANMVPRVVKQIELKDWPANGIPPSTNSLLETISVVEKCQTDAQEVRGKKFLALVHCRDGSSQAGTFCAISNLVDRLKNENCVDVFRTVKDIRDLRQGAIGNIELYKYCYQAVNEFLALSDLYANFK